MSFASLKKQSSLGSLTAKLVKEVEKTNNTGGGADERLWKPELDKTGNGYAVVRFLPAPDKEEFPWAKLYSHAFQGPGGWYIENSLTTNGGKDPVSDHNRELWNSGNESDKDVVRKQKRKLSFYSNIYVVKDPVNPANEGKVFLFKYGKKIFDKIMEAMQPNFEDETPINPFDFWQGANFKLKIKKVAGFWNYDSSEFDSVAPLLDDLQLEVCTLPEVKRINWSFILKLWLHCFHFFVKDFLTKLVEKNSTLILRIGRIFYNIDVTVIRKLALLLTYNILV